MPIESVLWTGGAPFALTADPGSTVVQFGFDTLPRQLQVLGKDRGQPVGIACLQRGDHFLMFGHSTAHFSGPSWPMKRMRFTRVCSSVCTSDRAALSASATIPEWIA